MSGAGISSRTFEKSEISQLAMESAISEVLTNPTYQASAERLAKLYRTKPNQPTKTLVEWTNFVLENGELPELVPEGAKLSLIQHYCIDVILVAIGILALVVYVGIRLIGLAIFKISRRTKNKVD